MCDLPLQGGHIAPRGALTQSLAVGELHGGVHVGALRLIQVDLEVRHTVYADH
jgi:hypothetical protein